MAADTPDVSLGSPPRATPDRLSGQMRWSVRVSLELATRASVFSVGAIVAFAVAAIVRDFLVVAGSFAVVFLVGGALWTRRSVRAPEVDVTLSSEPRDHRVILVWSAVSAALIPAAIVVGCVLAAPGFRGIPAGALAAWSWQEWRAFLVVWRFERREDLTLLAARPFLPYLGGREFAAVRSS